MNMKRNESDVKWHELNVTMILTSFRFLSFVGVGVRLSLEGGPTNCDSIQEQKVSQESQVNALNLTFCSIKRLQFTVSLPSKLFRSHKSFGARSLDVNILDVICDSSRSVFSPLIIESSQQQKKTKIHRLHRTPLKAPQVSFFVIQLSMAFSLSGLGQQVLHSGLPGASTTEHSGEDGAKRRAAKLAKKHQLY